MDDFVIEDSDDFVIVNRKPSAGSSKNLLSSFSYAEDNFMTEDEEILAAGGDFGFKGDWVMGEGEKLQGKGEESELPRQKEEGEGSCLLQNGVEPQLAMQVTGEESEMSQVQEEKLCLLPREGAEPILLPVVKERVEPLLSQEKQVESDLERVEPMLPEEKVELQLSSREKGVESQLEGMEPISLPQGREVESEGERNLLLEPPEEGVESHSLQQEGVEPCLPHQEMVEPHSIHQEGEESQLLPVTEDSSVAVAAERGGGVAPQELADTFT